VTKKYEGGCFNCKCISCDRVKFITDTSLYNQEEQEEKEQQEQQEKTGGYNAEDDINPTLLKILDIEPPGLTDESLFDKPPEHNRPLEGLIGAADITLENSIEDLIGATLENSSENLIGTGLENPVKSLIGTAEPLLEDIVDTHVPGEYSGSYEDWNDMTKPEFNKYKAKIKKISDMSEKQLLNLDWKPYKNRMRVLMEKQYETGGIATIVGGKVKIISETSGATYENGEAITHIDGSNADVPGAFVYHTHPYPLLDMEKIHLKLFKILPFMQPSLPDLIHSIYAYFDSRRAFDLLSTVEGLYIYRPGPKFIDSELGKKLKQHFNNKGKYPHKEMEKFKRLLDQELRSVYNRPFTLEDIHNTIRKLGFILYFVPNSSYTERYPYKTHKWKKQISFHKFTGGNCFADKTPHLPHPNMIMKYIHYAENL
jgi:hypothetical protein